MKPSKNNKLQRNYISELNSNGIRLVTGIGNCDCGRYENAVGAKVVDGIVKMTSWFATGGVASFDLDLKHRLTWTCDRNSEEDCKRFCCGNRNNTWYRYGNILDDKKLCS